MGPVIQTIESGGSTQALMSFDVVGLFRWIDAVFTSPSERVHRIGRRALSNLLVSNVDQFILFDDAIQQCYAMDPELKATQSYFSVIAKVIEDNPKTKCQTHKLFALALYQLGHKAIEVRRKAWEMLIQTEERVSGQCSIRDLEVACLSTSLPVQKRIQKLISARLAEAHPEQTLLMFSELCMPFNISGPVGRQDIVDIMVPWVSMIQLQLDPNGEDLSPSAYMVLVNLFEITVRHSQQMPKEVDTLWTSVASGQHVGNVKAVLDFLLLLCVEHRNSSFALYARSIVIFLSRSPSGSKLVEALITYFSPKAMVPVVREANPYILAETAPYPYTASLGDILPFQSKQVAFSYGQLALIFLVDLLVEPSPVISNCLPLLLHVVFMHLDHYIPLIHDAAKDTLINLCLTHMVSANPPADLVATRSFVDRLRDLKDPKELWQYDDVSKQIKQDGDTPQRMASTVKDVVNIFDENKNVDFRQLWGRVALSWATVCPVRHLACRAFQIFRCLSTRLDMPMLSDTLARLSSTVSDTNLDIQGFAMEILSTLNSVINSLDANGLLQFSQLFWVMLATLTTPYEQEFLQGIAGVQAYLDKVDLSDSENADILLAAMPPRWENGFQGLQPLILKGVHSSISMSATYRLLDSLAKLPINSSFVAEDSRLVFDIVANLPRMLHSFDLDEPARDILALCESLEILTEAYENTELHRIIDSFSKSKFRSKDEFKRQIIQAVRTAFFPEWEGSVLIFLLGMLNNKTTWMKIEVLELLKFILPHVDLKKAEFSGVGAEIISPLLRLLHTNLSTRALEVLDEAISISAGPMDKQILRMSLASRLTRTEFVNAATLFGVPEESGWSVPLPAKATTLTRANVHAVFYTCPTTTPDPSAVVRPEVQFHKGRLHLHNLYDGS